MQAILRWFDPGPVGPLRAALLPRLVALGALVLMAATWRLWTPQTDFPQIPLLRAAGRLPAWSEWTLLLAVAAALITAAIAPAGGRLCRRALGTFAVLTTLLFAVDQIRLQPWAYQMVVMAVVLAACDARRAVLLLRVLTISIYFYSALSKLDYTFLTTLGQQFLTAAAAPVEVWLQAVSPKLRIALAAVFPAVEMLTALALVLPRTRRLGLTMAVGMHAGLLFILGPWGLDHRPGVLLWNIWFIAQALLLWGFFDSESPTQAEPQSAKPPAADAPVRLSFSARFAHVLLGLVVVWPLLEPWGWCDPWPAWGLYAPRASGATIYVQRSELDRLPGGLRRTAASVGEGAWVPLDIDRWCLETLDAPIYPHSRVQLGVSAAIAQRYGLPHAVRVVQFGTANRFSGARHRETHDGLASITSAAGQYRLNAQPRARFQKFSP